MGNVNLTKSTKYTWYLTMYEISKVEYALYLKGGATFYLGLICLSVFSKIFAQRFAVYLLLLYLYILLPILVWSFHKFLHNFNISKFVSLVIKVIFTASIYPNIAFTFSAVFHLYKSPASPILCKVITFISSPLSPACTTEVLHFSAFPTYTDRVLKRKKTLISSRRGLV